MKEVTLQATITLGHILGVSRGMLVNNLLPTLLNILQTQPLVPLPSSYNKQHIRSILNNQQQNHITSNDPCDFVVDDKFMIWPNEEDTLLFCLDHLNSLRPTVQFTMELEDEQTIAFLAVRVQRKASTLSTSVYRKPPYTGHYILQPQNCKLCSKFLQIIYLRSVWKF